MKVLSLTEPCATLIKNGIKRVETRSWKTNYRGELYIHASKTKIPKEWKENREFMSLVTTSLHYGYIICKCKLKDCIYMTEEYVKDMKENHYQEYLYRKYEVGRYAWILEDLEILNEPIMANGQLNIWEYYNEFEIMDLMNDIQYGWIDKKGNKYIDDSISDAEFSNTYLLQTPKEIIKNKIGVCYDQVELERFYFKGNDWNIATYFLGSATNRKVPTHTFLTFEKNSKYYWFEHAFEKFRGIHEYSTLNELLLDVKNKFENTYLNNCHINLYQYNKPKYHIDEAMFMDHCTSGTKMI